MTKLFITGSSGQLATEFQRVFSLKGISFLAPSEKECDITDSESIARHLDTYKPTVLINCAAYNQVDLAEEKEALAYAINEKAVGVMAELCKSRGIVMVHYSSDYVFDGKKGDLYTEDDATHPLNVYGKSKLAGEESLKKAGGEYLLFRTSWVYGKGTQNFLYKVAEWAEKNPILRCSADEVSVPTYVGDIVAVTMAALEKNVRGLYHLVSSGYASRYEFAKEFIQVSGRKNRVFPVPMSTFSVKAVRPAIAAMSNKKICDTLGITIPDWKEGVKKLMHGV